MDLFDDNTIYTMMFNNSKLSSKQKDILSRNVNIKSIINSISYKEVNLSFNFTNEIFSLFCEEDNDWLYNNSTISLHYISDNINKSVILTNMKYINSTINNRYIDVRFIG